MSKKATIGFDLRALNGISKYRGIGMYTAEITNRITPTLSKKNHIIIYAVEASDLSNITEEAKNACEVMYVSSEDISVPLGPLAKITEDVVPSSMNVNTSLPQLEKLDVFWQPYFYFGLPENPNIKSIMVAYDFIPLVFLTKFFGKVHLRKHKLKQYALNIRRQIRLRSMMTAIREYERAHTVLSISENTKRDLALFTKTKQRNIVVTPLGPPAISGSKAKLPEKLRDTPFIVYIGGIDYRRDLHGLLDAFERLKQSNSAFKLALAGKDFENIRDPEFAARVKGSAYARDIINLGFVSDELKQQLYQEAVACTYPTLYEGFGLPILEAFTYGCPIITYKNSSTAEVGGTAALYASGPESLAAHISDLLKHPSKRLPLIENGLKQAEKFSWETCARQTLRAIEAAVDDSA